MIAQHDQAASIGERERAQKNSFDEREDRGGRSDAESECEDHG